MSRCKWELTVVVLAVFAMTGCKPKAPAPPAGPITFNQHIAPVLFQHCARRIIGPDRALRFPCWLFPTRAKTREADRGDFAASRDAASAQRINQSLLDDVNRHNLEYNTYLLERDPNNMRADVSLARAPFHAGQLPQAAAHLATARKFDPRDDDAARQDRSMIQEIQQSTRQILSFAGWTRQPHCVSYPSVP